MRRFLLGFVALGLLAGTVAVAQQPGVNSPFNPVWSIPLDSIKRTYGIGISLLSAQQSATDIFQICGATGRVTRVTRVSAGVRATAVATGDVVLVKRSTASVGGTTFQLSASAGIPHDASSAAGLSTVTAWSANPTVGTAVGNIVVMQTTAANLTTGVGLPPAIWTADRPASAIILRSAAQCLAVNLSTQTFSGNLWNVSVEWTEESP